MDERWPERGPTPEWADGCAVALRPLALRFPRVVEYWRDAGFPVSGWVAALAARP